jgi:lipoic acid synthetase
VEAGKPAFDDVSEPERVAAAASKLSLTHVVITSVTRDDLPDVGASVFADTVEAVRDALPGATIEVLTPDFCGLTKAIDTVLASRPDVFNHNIETVSSLYKTVRPQAIYQRSLEILAYAKTSAPEKFVKSGLMLGLGETFDEVVAVMTDLAWAGVDILTCGQYLKPAKKNLPVVEYVTPQKFDEIKKIGDSIGFAATFAGPYVRSSYHAAELFKKAKTS